MPVLSRRDFLAGSTLGLAAVGTLPAQNEPGQPASNNSSRPLRVAAINSLYRLRSHAYHICGRVIHGFTWNGFHHQPDLKLVRMFNHQQPPEDLGRSTCQTYGIELCDTVAATLGGPKHLDVDAVLLIIEHGDYPLNEYGQVLYPRYEMFEQIVDVFRQSGRSVPVFVDKHLSYDHQQAHQMVRTAKDMGFGLMAGSSLPVTWRIPEIEPPLGTPFTEGLVTFGFDRGSVEIYLFHALESLQVFLERRPGGETGVKSVQALQGDAVWQAAEAGRWSKELMHAALKNCQSQNVGPVRENVQNPFLVLIEYQDGTRGAVMNLIEQTSEFGFAGKVKDREEPAATCLYLPIPPAANFFNPLTYRIEEFFHAKTPPYPVERTLLTSVMCDLAMRSLHDNGRVISSPALNVTYAAPPSSGFARGSWNNGI